MNGSTFIGNLFLVYVVAQLLTTAYGLTVIGTLKPIIEEKLKNKGYSERAIMKKAYVLGLCVGK